MILRLSQKLCAKIKAGGLLTSPLDENPLADWSGHLFIANRTQYIILTNTKSLYSTLMVARGITNETQFCERALSSIHEALDAGDQKSVCSRCIARSSRAVSFAKPLDRSVVASMNELMRNAKWWLAQGGLSPPEIAAKFNDVLLSAIASDPSDKYGQPREAFRSLVEAVQIATKATVSHPPPGSPA